MNTLIEIAKSGLLSSQRSLSITANNIINADTPGYSRQRLVTTPEGMQMDGYYKGLGVNVVEVSRLRDEMNDILLNEKLQNMGYLKQKSEIYQKLEASLVSDYGEGLDSKITDMFDNFADLASNPQDMTVRDNLINKALQFTTKMHGLSRSIDQTSHLVQKFARKTVDSVNNLLKDINKLNQTIKRGEAKGQPDYSSLDIRTAKLSELSKLVSFESQVTSTGAVEIQIGGHSVLDENQAYTINAEIDDANKRFRLRLENGHLIEASGGKLGAQIEMYEEAIPDLKDKLDNLAATIVEEVNNIHLSGYGLDDNNQRAFFNPGATTAAQIEINQQLIDNPRNIAASDTAGEAGNGEIATKLADLRNQKVIGGNNQKLLGYAVNFISIPGEEIASLDGSITARDSEIQMLKTQQQQVAGVNIDEELSRLIKFQHSYQGAAKVIATAQRMYDTLLTIV